MTDKDSADLAAWIDKEVGKQLRLLKNAGYLPPAALDWTIHSPMKTVREGGEA